MRSAPLAASAAVQMELLPASVKLAAGETRVVTVVARNGSTAPVQKLHLGWTAKLGLTVTDKTGDKESLASGGTARWTVEVATAGTLTETTQIYFLLDYLQQDVAPPPSPGAASPTPAPTPATTTPGSGSAPLEIQPRTAIALEKLVEVKVESALKLLQDPHKGKIHVVVNNKSAVPVRVESITPQAPEDDLAVKPITVNKVVGPQAQETFALTVEADRKGVNPGKHILLFRVDLSWEEEGLAQSASVVSKHEFDVGVIGSELLTAVGVPSLLLLPGFLMILVFATFWNHVGTRPQIPLNLKSGEFWALAVLLSLTTALLYPHLTDQRNYLDRYGLPDVYRIWFGSAAAGCLAWALAIVARWLWQRFWRKRKLAYTFLPSDGPIDVLRKLARTSNTFSLNQANVSLDGKQTRVLVLHRGGDGQKARVAPRVVVKFKPEVAPADRADLETRMNAHLGKTGEPAQLADFLSQEQEHLDVKWEARDSLTGVIEVDATESTGAARQALVQYEG